MFFTRFLLGNLFCILFLGLICCLKKLMGKKIPIKHQYGVWGLFLLSMGAAFLPFSLFRWLQSAGPRESTLQGTITPNQSSGLMPALMQGSPGAQAVPLEEPFPLPELLRIVWIAGMVITAALYLISILKLVQIKRRAIPPSESIRSLCDACRKQAGVKRNVELLQSDLIEAPLSVRFRKNSILLPAEAIKGLTEREVRYILLHELMHIRHRDVVTNALFCAGQIVYWFNPLVWLAFSKMRLDREAYCDWSVLDLLKDPDEITAYGSTLIKFARQGKGRLVFAGTPLSGGKSQLRYRIEKIAGFQRESGRTARYGAFALLASLLLAAFQIPVLMAYSNRADTQTPESLLTEKELQRGGITVADDSAFFGDASGCAVIYSQNEGSYTVYGQERMMERIAPCSTYEIYSALNALELGFITPEDNTLLWDGTDHTEQSWNGDQSLASAMGGSVDWYFQQLDERAGAGTLSAFYERIGYGNHDLGQDLKHYWNGSALRVSPWSRSKR